MFFPYQKKQQKLLIILAVVILAAIGVLYFGLKGPEVSVDGTTSAGELTEPAASAQKKESKGELELDISLFKNPQYQDLRSYEAWSREKGGVGRENPFVPY